MIPQNFIDELIRRSEIYDVVSGYVRLTKKGGNYFGLCPFHGEKTPSFSVNQDKQIYHCFGCGKGGGVINFIMDIEGLSYVDAIRFLARRANMEVPEDTRFSARRRAERDRLLELNREAARFYHEVFANRPEGENMRAYAAQRQISRAMATRFGIGAAPDGWDHLIRAMGEKGFEKSELIKGGLAIENKDSGRIYDRFRNRLMFPIIDVRGNVVGFGGRVMDNSEPKYLNSPDTPVFNKSRNLFALNLAKKSKMGRLILCEGYMDVLSLHQAGFDCAVASLGTSMTQEHAQLLSRYTKEVVLSFDSDKAGVSAAQRAIRILGSSGLTVKVLRMEGAKDPDEYIKKFGRDAFARLLERSENHIEFRLMQIRAKYNDLEQDTEKIAFIGEAVELVASLPNAVQREIYATRVAEAAQVSPESVKTEENKALRRRIAIEKKKREQKMLDAAGSVQPRQWDLHYKNVRSALAEEGVIRLLLLDPPAARYCGELKREEFSSEALGKIYAILMERIARDEEPGIPALTGELTPEEMSLLTALAERPESTADPAGTIAQYKDIIKNEYRKRTGGEDIMDVWSRLRDKKGYGGQD